METTFSILMKPRVFDNDLPLNNPGALDLIIIRYRRDYTDGSNSNTDWIISYFDCKFVKPDDFKEFKSFSDIFKM